MDLNISIDFRRDVPTLTHELGHVFGNYDEYGGEGFLGWLERRMWWHDNDHLEDTNAVMNSGQREFRTRYFDHFQEYVNDHFEDLGIRYDLVQGPRRSLRPHSRTTWFFDNEQEDYSMSGVAFGYIPKLGGPRRVM
jgi:hypothetical protein